MTVSASTAYSEKNVRRSTAAAIARTRRDRCGDRARRCRTRHRRVVRLRIPVRRCDQPCAGGRCRRGHAARHARSARITLADTTGTATPRRIAEVLGALPDSSGVDLGLHLHDTRGTALANALWALEHGIRRFDTATGGLGGSPFAPGAGGNLATEDLVLVLDDLGISDRHRPRRASCESPARCLHWSVTTSPAEPRRQDRFPGSTRVSIAERRTVTRRQELLAIAADQFAAFGFHNVTVDDIGRAAGISGPALYHHFAGKEALLGEMLVSISQQLLDGGRHAGRESAAGPARAVDPLPCQFAVDNRSLITVHFRDLIHASVADRRRVRRLQATYASLWTEHRGCQEPRRRRAHRPRAAVHATFGLINSTPFSSTLPRAAMIDLLSAMSSSALGGLR